MKDSGEIRARTSIADWLPHFDFVLDSAPADVWPLVVHWERWIKDYRVEHISGQQDAVGERKQITLLDQSGKASGHFSVEVVRFLPGKQLAYRILPLEEPAFGYDAVRGYEIFRLYDLRGKTLVTYQTVAQLESSRMQQADFDVHVQQSLEAGSRAWPEKYIPELRRLLQTAA
jgi:hypothetical protein